MKVGTSKGKARLAAPGYYIEYYGAKGDLRVWDTIYISTEGKCQYIPVSNDLFFKNLPKVCETKWCTLLWTCAPTKKKIEKENVASDSKEMDRYLYFETHAELLKFKGVKLGTLIKSDLDK